MKWYFWQRSDLNYKPSLILLADIFIMIIMRIPNTIAFVRQQWMAQLENLRLKWASFIFPWYAYIAYGVKTSWTSERIPFTVPNSADEFLINILLQTIIFVHAIWAYFALEVACTLSANVVNVAPRLSTNDLAHTIQRYNDKNISRLELRCEMRNFVKSTCDTDK